jgi:hypothetical protein
LEAFIINDLLRDIELSILARKLEGKQQYGWAGASQQA